MNNKKATVAQVKRLGALRDGWAGFKHRLMVYLEVGHSDIMKWDVPPEWQAAYKKARGW